jgi:hypothetical protein
MAATPANPCPRTVLEAELAALDGELWSLEGGIGGERLEAASMLVHAARELVARARDALDRDALALLRVAAACVASVSAAGELDLADVAAALVLIAKTATAETGDDRPADPRFAHVRAALAVIAGSGAGEPPPRDSSRSADGTPAGDA